jgi:hypothetical protein
MMMILERFEEGRGEEEDLRDVLSGLDGEEEDGEGDDEDDADEEGNANSLSSRLAALGISLNVDDAPPEVIWDALTLEERETFLKTLRDPKAVGELSVQAQEVFVGSVWWNVDEDENEPPLGTDASPRRRRRPEMNHIPPTLIPQSVDLSHPRPRPPLIYNLVAIRSAISLLCPILPSLLILLVYSLAYAHTIRLTASPLPVPGKGGDQAIDLALDTLETIIPFIFDRTSKHTYTALEEIFVDFWARVDDVSRRSNPPPPTNYSLLNPRS